MSGNNQRKIESFFQPKSKIYNRPIEGENETSSSKRPRIQADSSSQSEFPPIPIPSVTDEGSVAVSILYSVLIIRRIYRFWACVSGRCWGMLNKLTF